ncbi:MAG: M48 family metallopeptidase [Chloroflexi bacterium]|nr:MAG: M48 family metallopeptidase [Chloroflexota bacterium]
MNNHQNSFSPPIRILATRRRRRTVSARLRSGVLEVMVPASMSVAERERWVELMRERIERQMRRKLPTDQRLAERAKRLNDRYFAGRLSWTSIGYTDTVSLWGSCTFTIGAIRVASRMKAFPDWVVDYVLMHELTHLVHSNHGPAFHEMLDRYPMAERAKGYLIAAQQLSQMPGGA